MIELFAQYMDVISRHEHDLGEAHLDGKPYLLQYHLKDKSKPPFWQNQWPLPTAHLDYLDNFLEEYQQIGLIESSTSDYNSCIFLVKKSALENPNMDKDYVPLRLVCDFRLLNSNLHLPKYTLPTIKQTIDQIGRVGPTHFSKLDLTKFFWQFKVHEKSRDLLSFCIPGKGQFRFVRAPMGIHAMPMVAQRYVDLVLKPLMPQRALAFLDDVLLMSKGEEDMLISIQKCFDCLRNAKLKVRLEKSQFCVQQISFLGHTLTPEGYTAKKDNLAAIQKLKYPDSIRGIRSTLGMSNFYHNLIKGYSLLVAPLTYLLRKESNYQGGPIPETAKKAFDNLKAALTTPPVLSYIKPKGELSLFVDAAEGNEKNPGGLAAALFQEQNGLLKPVSYASRTLKPHEAKMGIFCLEQLAACWGIQYHRTHLTGRRFKLYSDNRPLETSLNKTQVKTLNRLQQLLLEFDFTIHRVPSAFNCSDHLSRHALNDEKQCVNATAINFNFVDENDLKELQQQCPISKILTNYVLRKEQPIVPSYKQIVKKWGPFCKLINGILYIQPVGADDPMQFCPTSITAEVIMAAHAACGHGRLFKTSELIKTQFFWPSLLEDTREALEKCNFCAKTAGPNRAPNTYLGELPKTTAPFERLSLDTYGPVRPCRNYKWVMIVCDEFTNYLNFFPLESRRADEVARVFVNEWCSRFGIPKSIITDKDLSYCSDLSKQIYEHLGIKKLQSTAYHPQVNARSETNWAGLTKQIRALFDSNIDNWIDYLPLWQLQLNSGPSKRNLKSSYELLFGCPPSFGPFHPSMKLRHYFGNDFASLMINRIAKIRKIAEKLGEEYKMGYTAYYNSKVRPMHFPEGSLVYLWTPRSKKEDIGWKGPFLCVQRVSEHTTLIQHLFNLKTQLVSNLRLKPFKGQIPSDATTKVDDTLQNSDVGQKQQQQSAPQNADTHAQNLFYDTGDVVVLNPESLPGHRPRLIKAEAPLQPGAQSQFPAAQIKTEQISPSQFPQDSPINLETSGEEPFLSPESTPQGKKKGRSFFGKSFPTIDDVIAPFTPSSSRLTRRQAAERNITISEQPLPGRQTSWYQKK